MSEVLLKIDHMKKHFPVPKSKKAVIKAVDDVSFEIREGEILGVVGESGCGKSTLARCVMRLTDITEGSILFKGEDITNYSKKEMEKIRPHMQMVFQNPFSSFNPRHTIRAALSNAGKQFGMTPDEIRGRIDELLDAIGLDKAVLDRRPGELSGGQLQRLAIARALMARPEFILADEAVSALDVSVQAQILNMIMELRDKYHLTMMFISHELTVVEHICDYVIVMYLGAIVEMGRTEQLFGNTAHPYTEALLSAKPREHPDVATNRIILEGDVPNAMDIPKFCRFHTRCPYFIPGRCDAEYPPLAQLEDGHWAACHLAADKANKQNQL